ncbi:hypothetical protein McanCB56680_005155 [Microsporum canis]
MSVVSALYAEWPRLGAAALISALIFKFIIYPIFLSPLSKIPSAHPLAPITGAWIKWHRWQGTDFEAIAAAFEKNGPYVRLGPTEVATNCKEGFDSAYGVGKRNFDRFSTYNYFINHGTRNMFTSLDAKQHSRRRGRISTVYSRAYIQSSPHFQALLKTMLLGRMMPIFDQASETKAGSVDVLPLLHAYPLDFMSAFVFGLSEGHNLIRDLDYREKWLGIYQVIFMSNAASLLGEFRRITQTLTKFGAHLLPKGYFEIRQLSEDWASSKARRAEQSIQKSYATGEPLAPGELPIVYNAVRNGIAQENGVEKSFTPSDEQFRELASECNDQIGSAGDTMGIAFSYLFYELSRHPTAQDDLRQELLSLPAPFYLDHSQSPSQQELPPPEDLQRLPFLNAVIRESLRLRNSPPGMDPRVTPQGCLSDIGPYKNIPPGVRIGAYTHLLHRSSDLYDDPLVWNPYRWLKKNGQYTDGKNKALFSFSGGSRGCIGQHIGMELMRNALAAVYTNYKTTVADESEYPGNNGFVAGDGTEKIWIEFRKLEQL